MSLGMPHLAAPLMVLGLAGAAVAPPMQPPGPPSEQRAQISQAACVARLPLEVRIGQTMLVITDDPAGSAARLAQGRIAGLLSTGILSRAQASAFRAAARDTRYGAVLAADEEGGLVQRYRKVVGKLPSAATQTRTLTTGQVRQLYAAHGRKLRDWGVNVVFAPVVDVGGGPGIGSRAYSAEPDVVTDYAGAAAAGYRDAGLLPVLKHFPGHGRATADTHLDRSIGPGLASLRKVDLVPYRRLIGRGELGVMVGHTEVPGFSDKPSTQSKRVIGDLLRGELGFAGLVVSDALGMRAAGQSQGKALVGFLAAGGDVGIVGPGGAVAGDRAIRAALAKGRLSQAQLDRAAARVLAAKGLDACVLAGRPAVEPTDAPQPTPDPRTPDAPITNPTRDPQS